MTSAAEYPAGFWHEAVAYSSSADLAARLAPRVNAALQVGQQVTTVLAAGVTDGLRASLGSAADQVAFLEPGRVHTVPGFTTAVRWARRAAHADEPGFGKLIIGQQLLDLPGCGPGYWTRLCLGLEVATAGLALTVLCPFAANDAGWARIRPTHRALSDLDSSTGRPGSAPNPTFRPPGELIREHPLPPPPDPGPPEAELAFRAPQLAAVRQLIGEVAVHAGLAPDRATDAVLAVNEVASNSIEHGPGSGRLRLWTDGGQLLAEITDDGRLADPFPGLVRPPVSNSRGRGLWMASELCDVMEVWTERGTTVRLSWAGAEGSERAAQPVGGG